MEKFNKLGSLLKRRYRSTKIKDDPETLESAARPDYEKFQENTSFKKPVSDMNPQEKDRFLAKLKNARKKKF